jgi:UDP-N-acetyl-D-mannosaminuronic acid dehydrogenase
VKTDSLETAEIVKLINNSYRDMVFAYANQIALICKSLGLNAKEVIQAANFEYPRSNVQVPGVVGGFCLEKDPHILINSSNCDSKLIKAAKEINEGIPYHILERIKEHLKEKNKSSKKAKIFISGFAFKGQPETDDIRSSQAVKLISLLQEDGVDNIFGHDFIVSENIIKCFSVEPCSLENGFKNADVVIFMNNHKKYDQVKLGSLSKKMKKDGYIFDGWQVFYEQLKDLPSGILYESIGFKNKK